MPLLNWEELMRPQLQFFCNGIMAFDVVFHPFSTKKGAVIYEDRTISVETIPLRHRMPCCGFIFREKPALPHIKRDMIDYLGIPTSKSIGSNWEVIGRKQMVPSFPTTCWLLLHAPREVMPTSQTRPSCRNVLP